MLYTITVEVKRTTTYEVSAIDEAEAHDIYLEEGDYITSTETDRKIIDTEETPDRIPMEWRGSNIQAQVDERNFGGDME
tara:strand:- start:1427 stop:1663 length:237 start_codon:yes stop_codon:yes gene_type:complete